MFMHRKINGTVNGVTVKKNGSGAYHATFTIKESSNRNYLELPDNPVGIDLRLKSLIARTDGEQ